METGPGEVTKLLARLQAGEMGVRDQLMELVYNELRRMAAARMRAERAGHTLTPTALVHEAYLRFGGGEFQDGYQNRGHFLAIASQAMRRALVDHARARRAMKRNGNQPDMLGDFPAPESDKMTVALDHALRELESLSPRQCQVVEMRYFGGLTESEVAGALGVTRRTVSREWQIARAWLHARIGDLRE